VLKFDKWHPNKDSIIIIFSLFFNINIEFYELTAYGG